MAVGTTYVVPPVLASAVIVMSLFTGVAGQAGLRDRFWIKIFEVDDLRLVAAALDMGFAWSVTGLAALHFVLPALKITKFGVLGSRIGLELILVARCASFASDISIVSRGSRHRRTRQVVCGARTEDGIECSRREPCDRKHRKRGEQHYF